MEFSNVTPTGRIIPHITKYNSSSFFVSKNNTLYKYKTNLTLDQDFNSSQTPGYITFDQSEQLFPNSIIEDQHYAPFISPILFKDFIIIGAEYIKDGYFYPYLTCYNIKNIHTPKLEISFFTAGYHIPLTTNDNTSGVYSLSTTPTIVPGFFFTSGTFLTYTPLPDSFTKKLLGINDKYLSYLKAQAEVQLILPIPFLI